MDLIMEVCNRRINRNCLGCPFKEKATRRLTCMEWADQHREEAEQIAQTFIANGYCIYDRRNPPYVGELPNGKIQQVCKNCDHTVVLSEQDFYRDEYIEKWMFECPVCHKQSPYRERKKKAVMADAV